MAAAKALAAVGAYVIDASVAVKWFMHAEDSALQALALRSAHVKRLAVLSAPDLLVYEVVNALRYSPAFNEDQVAQATSSLFGLELELVAPNATVTKRAARLAAAAGVSLYDAVYLALAEAQCCLLVTADDKLCRKLAAHPLVAKLRDLDLGHEEPQ